MDLVYSDIYRAFDIGQCFLPVNVIDLYVLDNTFNLFYSLNASRNIYSNLLFLKHSL
jgi:hypothetical protein